MVGGRGAADRLAPGRGWGHRRGALSETATRSVECRPSGRHFFYERPANQGTGAFLRLNDDAESPIVNAVHATSESFRGTSMNKNELISAVAEKADLSKQQANGAVDAVFEVLSEAMAKGDDVRLVGFGTFAVSHRAASKGRNPSTGAEVDIPARNVPKFTPGKGLKDAVNTK
ncbi:HU family DNA-binding protein [Mangrovibrevibacter kandeliae]|uniref:HU family DNA-binding protein n=1 Tax=Mangrovibrevibacter kandeliae TaxID=2968473 RepID=UPI004038896A